MTLACYAGRKGQHPTQNGLPCQGRMLSYCAIGQNRQAVLSIASKCAILGAMAFTAFVSRSKPGNQVAQRTRVRCGSPGAGLLPAGTGTSAAEHPYHPGPHGQAGVSGLCPDHRLRPEVQTAASLREAGPGSRSSSARWTRPRTRSGTLIRKLEKGLNIRALHAHVHKDEGHIDEKTWQGGVQPAYPFRVSATWSSSVTRKVTGMAG